MHTTDEHNSTDCPALLELAAYFDCRLSEVDADRIALHLARCGDCLAMVRDLREAQNESDPNMTFVPEPVITRAQALVERSIADSPFTIWLRRGAAVAAAVAIGVVGHAVGGSLSDTRAASAATLDDELLFGLFDAGIGESEFFAIAADNAGSEEAAQ